MTDLRTPRVAVDAMLREDADGLPERVNGNTAYYVLSDPSSLSAETKASIYHWLVPTSTAAFGADMAPYWRDREADGYLDRITEFVVIGDSDRNFVGWTGFHRLQSSVSPDATTIYIDSTGVVPEHQGQGLLKKVFRDRLTMDGAPCGGATFYAARSESPIFFMLMRTTFGASAIFPRPSTNVPSDVSTAALELARWLGQESIFDATEMRIEGAYSNLDALYGELPSSGDGELDEFIRKSLGPLDAFLMFARPASRSELS
jgi:acetyltransferase (GNAT) family protein